MRLQTTGIRTTCYTNELDANIMRDEQLLAETEIKREGG